MKKLNYENPLILFSAGSILSVLIFYILKIQIPEKTFLYGFLFKFWPIQFFNTWLFSVVILFVIARYYSFKDERELLKELTKMPDYNISRKEAQKLLMEIPKTLSRTLCYRRISEILKGYLYGENIIGLNEELSRRDLGMIERGHLLLESMRQIIPVVGFLGTVIGLSQGMSKFPQIASSAGNIGDLKGILKNFAADLSVAFDTTLLALSYTIVVILLASLLRGKEETYVSEVDEKARDLISRLKSGSEGQDQDAAGQLMDVDKLFEIFRQNSDNIVKKLDEIKNEIKKPEK